MAVLLMLIAGALISLSNLFMRKSIDQGGSTKGFLIFQMLMAFVVAVMLNPVRTGSYEYNHQIAIFGALTGLVMAFMLYFLGKSLEKGPAGLTFSILNASTVMPAIVMAVLFGSAMGYPYTLWHAVGSFVVVAGLFLAGTSLAGLKDQKAWISFVSLMFLAHVVILVAFQFRALLLNHSHPEMIASIFSSQTIKSQWFSPFMFLVAFVMQVLFFMTSERRVPKTLEMAYGLAGGLLNGLCTYLMIWSTEVASPLENAIIFPIFSVMTIFLSNLWSQRLYQENVDWRACKLCTAGLVIATVDWKTVSAFIGL